MILIFGLETWDKVLHMQQAWSRLSNWERKYCLNKDFYKRVLFWPLLLIWNNDKDQYKARGREPFVLNRVFTLTDICLTLINDLDNLLNVSLYSLIKDNQWVKYDPYWAKGREIESCQVISHPKGCHWIYKIYKLGKVSSDCWYPKNIPFLINI